MLCLQSNFTLHYQQGKFHTMYYRNSEIKRIKKVKSHSQLTSETTNLLWWAPELGCPKSKLVWILDTPHQLPQDRHAVSISDSNPVGSRGGKRPVPLASPVWKCCPERVEMAFREKAPAWAKLRYKHCFINYSRSLQLSILHSWFKDSLRVIPRFQFTFHKEITTGILKHAFYFSNDT